MSQKKQHKGISLLGQWLLDYVARHNVTLTELSRRAGLSQGTLRSLIYYPDRLPTLETCLYLSQATGQSATMFLQMSGAATALDLEQINLERANLLRIYDQLSPPSQRLLIEIAGAIQRTGQDWAVHSSGQKNAPESASDALGGPR